MYITEESTNLFGSSEVLGGLHTIDTSQGALDEVSGDWFRVFVEAAHYQCKVVGTEPATYFKGIETQYKEVTGAARMPNVYRSAKSVIAGSFKLDLPVVDVDGAALGKSAMQAAIKAAKAEADTSVYTEERLRGDIYKLCKKYAWQEDCDTATIVRRIKATL